MPQILRHMFHIWHFPIQISVRNLFSFLRFFPCENWECISKNILIKLPSTWIIHHSQVCVILLKSPKCDRNNNIGQARVHNTQLFKIKFGRGSPIWNFKVYIILYSECLFLLGFSLPLFFTTYYVLKRRN